MRYINWRYEYMWDDNPKDDWEIDLGDEFATDYDDELDELEEMLFADDIEEEDFHVRQERHAHNYDDSHSLEDCCHDDFDYEGFKEEVREDYDNSDRAQEEGGCGRHRQSGGGTRRWR